MNSKVSLGGILAQAWKIFWRFKVLWLISALANLGLGLYISLTESGNNLLRYFINLDPSQVSNFFKSTLPADPTGTLLTQYGGWLSAGLVLLFSLGIVFYILNVFGRAALIKAVRQADLVETLHATSHATSLPNFGELWSQGRPYFWPLFWLDSLLLLPLIVWLATLAGGLWSGLIFTVTSHPQNDGLAAMLYGLTGFLICGMCGMTIVSVLLGFIADQASNAIVLEDLSVRAGLQRGWNVFKSAWLNIVLLTLVVGVINAITGFAVVFPIQMGLQVVSTLVPYSGPALTLLGIASFLLYLPVVLLVYGLQAAYRQTGMTLLYLRLTAEPAGDAPVV